MRLVIIVSVFFFLANTAIAQNISISEDSEVSRVMDQYGATNRMTTNTTGWRIQLMATTDRIKMEKAKENFLRDHPFIAVDWMHASPYYKLLAGAFSSKLEATRILHLVKKDYPSAFPAKSKTIKPGELVGLRYN